MLIDTKNSFELNGQQFPIASDFPMLDERALLWVASGVYYGYPKSDIKIFYDNITNKVQSIRYEILPGAGYVTYDKDYDRDVLLSYIKENRYCTKPFPHSGRVKGGKGFFKETKENQQEIVKLLCGNENFSQKVLGLLYEISFKLGSSGIL